MKSRRRRGCRAVDFTVDSLISVFILELFSDIRRERHISYLFENIFKDAVKSKFYIADSLVFEVCDFTRHLSEVEFRADFKFFCGTRNTFPRIVIQTLEQKHFGIVFLRFFCPRKSCSKNSRGNNLCIIDNQYVAFFEIIAQIVKMSVLYMSVIFVIDKHSRGISRLERRLSYKLLW